MQATAEQIAFVSPAGERLTPSRERPVDMVHLARQSFGDKALETEILSLFRQQLALTSGQLKATSGLERKRVAHTIKGSAKAVGAFALARIAARIEDAPLDDGLLGAVDAEIARIRDFIAGLAR
ncbi:MAG: Hpt domain-containing protein [Rhizobiaceae bacterium]|jgi:HPt (histidine-containing phosphotransfer) domain-containing protein|nr:Hpt domain-containing protein [Rhizobiaceae bacterium]